MIPQKKVKSGTSFFILIFRRLFLIDFFTKIGASEKLAFIAIIVSIFSVVISVIQFKEIQRQFKLQFENSVTQQHLSVRPLIVAHSISSVQGTKSGYCIANGGHGPAIIKNIKVVYDGKKLNRIGDLNNEFENAPDKFYNDITKVTFAEKVDSIIPLLPNEQFYIFSIHPENVSNRFLLANTMDKMTVEVEYESLYKETFNFVRKAKNRR